jgi:hypothetical protein
MKVNNTNSGTYRKVKRKSEFIRTIFLALKRFDFTQSVDYNLALSQF